MMSEKTELDRIDRHILALLQKDARMSNRELAATVGLAASSCHGRVQRLLESGVLRGFHAEVDPHALGIHLQSVVAVQLTGNPKERIASFLTHARALEEVVEIFHVAGKNDLLLHVAVRDVDHLRRLVMEELSARPEVAQIESVIVYAHERGPGFPDLVDGHASERPARAKGDP